MKVVIINTSEKTGGAAIAANRLMQALNRNGVCARMLVRDKQTDDECVTTINATWLKRKINLLRFVRERIAIFFNNKFNHKTVFQVSIANTGTDISNHPLVKEADIIHLHWINQGFLSLKDIDKLTGMGKPVVWTMHDMWPCTSICHHSRECNNFMNSCGMCFYLESSKPSDLSNKIFERKNRILQSSDITFVACSRWLMHKTRQSALTKSHYIESIPNTLNQEIYKSLTKGNTREGFNLPTDKFLLLFGALNIADERKGVYLLIDALKHIKEKMPDLSDKIELVVFGQAKKEVADLFPTPIHSLGYISDDSKIATLYNAVDVFVTASLEENLPNTIMESMACGTPCIGFEVGGIPEMIDHKINGYLAQYGDTKDMANGIKWIFNNSKSLNLHQECIKKVQSNYTEQIVSNKYISLYQKLINR